MTTSQWELLFIQQIHDARLAKPELEYRFYPTRRWRFDFAWARQQVAVEIEGGVYTRGRHVRGKGFTADCEKYNAASEMGWRVFRYPSSMIEDGTAIAQMIRVLERQNE